jgi:predicted TIM-barrel fold metal-dependent hydrolase
MDFKNSGVAKGIFMVDTHVHAQRHAYGFQKKGEDPDYAALSSGMSRSTVYDNSPRLLYHMDRYGVDVAVIFPAFGMTNDIDLQIVDAHPDRFIALAWDVETRRKSESGEKPWNIKDSIAELDQLLSTGRFKGIGEGFSSGHQVGISWQEHLEMYCQYVELCRKYKAPAQYHTGFPNGYVGGPGLASMVGNFESPWANPLHAHELAALYPDVPIILCHSGVEGSGYYTELYKQCLHVAASHHNVYLECGQWWAELYEVPLKDPNIGAEKLVWGTDWGASCTPQSWMPGCVPETFCSQDNKIGPPSHQVDVYGWSLRELGRLNIPQDDLNLILGGNAVRLFGIKTPHTRLFKEYLGRPSLNVYPDHGDMKKK